VSLPDSQVDLSAIDSLKRDIADLKRQVREMAAARTAAATTIPGDGALTIMSADGTRKLVLTDSRVRIYPDLVSKPDAYFYWYIAAPLHVAESGYYTPESDNHVGGVVRHSPAGLDLFAYPDVGGAGEMQWLAMDPSGGITPIGTIGNFVDNSAAWYIGKVTGQSAGNITVTYPNTYKTVPYPIYAVKASTACTHAITAYSTSGFTVNVGAGPTAGSVEVMVWAPRPTNP